MREYDYIFAGGGAAGLSLAYHLTRGSGEAPSILILDLDDKRKNDRTWCFWTNRSTGLEEIYHHTWDQLWFFGENFESKIPLGKWRYVMIRGIDFYNWMREQLGKTGRVDFIQAEVQRIVDDADRPVVETIDEAYTAGWVFDSRVLPGSIQIDRSRYHYLHQHFLGWEIETTKDIFDPDALTLFDFRTPQKGVMRFMYILPHSARRALVEYTLFSADLLNQEEYEQALREYLVDVLKVSDYHILDVEQNRIPMTDYPFQRRLGKRIWAIGTLGGRVKPSSGYAFWRIWNDAVAVATAVKLFNDPSQISLAPARYAWFDQVMLNVMYRQGHLTRKAFTWLFMNNSPERIFKFLNEENLLFEDVKVLLSLPILPFFKSFWRTQIQRKI